MLSSVSPISLLHQLSVIAIIWGWNALTVVNVIIRWRDHTSSGLTKWYQQRTVHSIYIMQIFESFLWDHREVCDMIEMADPETLVYFHNTYYVVLESI